MSDLSIGLVLAATFLIAGLVTGATGVFVIPAVPRLQALGFERDDLVQALCLSFTVATVCPPWAVAAWHRS